MTQLAGNGTKDERCRERCRRLTYRRSLVGAEKAAVVICALAADVGVVVAVAILAAALWGSLDAVWREPLFFGGFFGYCLPITILGAYWGIVRFRAQTESGALSFFKRGFIGAGVSVMIGGAAAGGFIGLILLASVCGVM
jgi:hypothetical protein